MLLNKAAGKSIYIYMKIFKYISIHEKLLCLCIYVYIHMPIYL